MPRFFIVVAGLALNAAACAGTAESTGSDASAATITLAPTTTLAPITTLAPTTTMTPTTTMAVDDHTDDEGAVEVDRTIEVTMTEFAFGVDPVEIVAGETIEFVVINAGVVPHEFRLSNAHRIEEHMASRHEGHGDGGDGATDEGHHQDGDVVLTLEAGETSTLVATFPEDVTMFTEVACLLPGHYEAGMHTDIAYAA
jgi:uncharacterized cupredoxin-like copper-binding protein